MINLKALIEKREAIIGEMEQLIEKAKTETRGMSIEENARFEELRKEAAALKATIDASEELRQLERKEARLEPTALEKNQVTIEEKAFANYLRGRALELRDDPPTDTNITFGDNGAVVPTSIVHKIIDKVVEISPLFSMATRYNAKGTLTIPYYDGTTSDITVAYAEEFTELTSTAGSFKSISLTGFLAGVLTKISKSLLNNSDFDILAYTISKMAQNIAVWIENELINGTNDKIDGLSKLTPAVTGSAATFVLADELIDLQEAIPDAYQANACWIMSRATRKAIRKLKDGQGNYLLNKDFTARWGYTLLGKDVYISKNAANMAANAKAIYYGDFSGLAVKVSENAEIQVLREKYATQHAIGVVAYVEMDSKVENSEKIAVLKMGAADPQ